jgi:hypothetical protein
LLREAGAGREDGMLLHVASGGGELRGSADFRGHEWLRMLALASRSADDNQHRDA